MSLYPENKKGPRWIRRRGPIPLSGEVDCEPPAAVRPSSHETKHNTTMSIDFVRLSCYLMPKKLCSFQSISSSGRFGWVPRRGVKPRGRRIPRKSRRVNGPRTPSPGPPRPSGSAWIGLCRPFVRLKVTMHNTESVHANSRREQSNLLPLPPGALETPEDTSGALYVSSPATRRAPSPDRASTPPAAST
jgi:hypothetical protein